MTTKLARTDDVSFVRDITSSALLNTDKNALARARAVRSSVRRAAGVEREVHSLREQVSELSQLVRQLLANGSKF